MSNVPVLASVRAALEFRRLHWREVGGVLAFMAATQTVAQAGSAAGDKGLTAVGEMAGLVAVCMATAALLRIAFADENPDDPEFRPGAGGFQWGKPEWRLIGAGAVLVFTFMIYFVLALVVGVLFVLATGLTAKVEPQATPEQIMAALGPGGAAALAALVVSMTLVGLYIALRLSLAPAATIARRAVVVFPSWRMTKGQVLRIFAATFLSSIPTLLASLVAGVLLRALGEPTGPQGAYQAAMPLALLIGAIPGVVSGFVQTPISVGLTAYLYRGLRPAGEK
jgi:hypothetical protein